ncbi:DUF4192 domain-containing protein [Specibacter sp. NPDC078692]|uniref:DUF4192 domain-containing protein n=1 Tax=Specibacter sp. NPDC078692 TaxID=3155818 RepID=UPI003434370C
MNTEPEKIKVSAGEDLLAFIPHMVGYWPETSIVCIAMKGKKLRATMRLDLPPDDATSRETVHFASIAATQLACDTESDGCLIAIFGRCDWLGPKKFPHAKLYRHLRQEFAAQGLPVRDAWFVGTDHWRSLECTDATCCPWPGKSNAAIKESFVNAEFIFRGSMVGEAPKEQVAQLTTVRDPEFVAEVAGLGEKVKDPLTMNGCGAEQLTATLQAWQFSLELWPQPPDACMCAFLLASLADRSVRDAVMVLLATSAEYALAGAAGLGITGSDMAELVVPVNWYGGNQAAGRPVQMGWVTEELMAGAAYDFGNILVGGTAPKVEGDEPCLLDWERLDGAEPFLQFLAQATQTADKAPVLCILGWIQWCKGRGSWAGQYFLACMEYQPGYRLAALLDQLLSGGHVAECAKDPVTAWHRDNRDNEEVTREEKNEGKQEDKKGEEFGLDEAA